MQDVEIQSLLEEAGYRYLPATGRYVVLEEGIEEGEDFATEDIADQLEIPVEDLLRWEQEQQE
jgi:3-polyprenyl-4-hydroxybenzoate decarboxylase